jgi:hypothetical protein
MFFQQVQLFVSSVEVTFWWVFGEKIITAFYKNRVISSQYTYVVEPKLFLSAPAPTPAQWEPQIRIAAPALAKLYVTDEITRIDGTHLG